MHEAKTRLSKLVEAIESGREDVITIARNGKPVARLVSIDEARGVRQRIGVAKGVFALPEQTTELDGEVAGLFVAEGERTHGDDGSLR